MSVRNWHLQVCKDDYQQVVDIVSALQSKNPIEYFVMYLFVLPLISFKNLN